MVVSHFEQSLAPSKTAIPSGIFQGIASDTPTLSPNNNNPVISTVVSKTFVQKAEQPFGD